MYAEPITLSHRTVTLEPLLSEHAQPLFDALNGDEEVWRFLPSEMPRTLEAMQQEVEASLAAFAEGSRLQFAVKLNDGGRIIGSTGFYYINEANRHLEIGGTWYAREFWRTAVNTECKYLLLTHAFETLGCVRVQLRTDERNERSRAAIERIGGVLEGIVRKDRVIKDGFLRSSAQFSLLADEWPANKKRLEALLARGPGDMPDEPADDPPDSR